MTDHSIRVLLSEDDDKDAAFTQSLLREIGPERFRCDVVRGFDETLRAIARGGHDVYVIDNTLGKHTGVELLQKARENGCSRPIILLTDRSERSSDLAAMQAGASDYLLKSRLDAETLERSIRYALAHHRTLDALRESEERYALSARGANDGLWVWDLRTDAVYFSPRWKQMLGFEEDEISDKSSEWFGRVHSEDIDQLKSDLQLHIEGLTPHFENEHRVLTEDGTYRWMLSRGLAVRDVQGNASRIAGSQTDVTERKLAFEQLTHDAFHDSLTDLPNRALFMDRLERALKNARRHPEQLFAVLFLDLDRFKVINDSLGHLIGDQMLVAVGQRLRATLRSIDTVARVGGDEFAILLENMDHATDAARVARRIHDELFVPFQIGEHEMYTTVSIGIALSTTGYEKPQDMLRDSDIAMYRAKSQGKARHEVFDKAMHEHAVRLLQIETDLRRALERGELSLNYQPIVSLETGFVTGFEALLRWQRPDRMIGADELIPIAEETGLILPIGQWVLRTACTQMEAWHRKYPSQRPLTVHVNLSPKQFLQPSLVESIQQILLQTGLDPRSLNLEVTETVVVDNPESATALLSQLRSMRIQLALDDFGQGYSSLSTLHRYPFHMLKIDRSFIVDLDQNPKNIEFVRAIATFARILGMEVTVEGVETAEQLARVRTLGIGQAQGYYFSRPVNIASAEAFLDSEPRWAPQKLRSSS